MPRTQTIPPVSSLSSSTAQIPNDVLVIIVSMLDRPTLKQVRLCCRWLAHEATRRLFATVSFQMRAVDMERVIAIASCSTTANAVKELQLEQLPRLPKYKYEDWKRDARTSPGRSSHENPDLPRILRLNEAKKLTSRTDRGSGQDVNQGEPGLPPLTRQLFREYRDQRKEPKLWVALHTPGPSFSETILDSSNWDVAMRASGRLTWRQQLRRLQKACFDFEKALLSLPNLQQLRIDHNVTNAIYESYWRGYYFTDRNFSGMEFFSDVGPDVAPIAFLLQILGKRNSSYDSLTSLRLNLDCEMWWNLNHLEFAWASPEDGQYEDEDTDEEPFIFRSHAITKKNLSMAEEAFIHLTDIRIDLARQDEDRKPFEALARYLSKATNLARLELSVEEFEEITEGHDMLSRINDCARWPKLRHLRLEGYHFCQRSFLRTLSLVAPTLESLSLKWCILLDLESSWSTLYDAMRLIPFDVLDHLHFTRCFQNAFQHELLDNPHETPQRGDGDPLPVVHMMEEVELAFQYIIGYSPEIYDYILKRTDTKPPLQLFREFPNSRDGFEEFFSLL